MDVDLNFPRPDEETSRFIFSSSQIRADGTLKHTAYAPRNGSTSVFRTSGLNEEEIWNICGGHVASSRTQACTGRGVCTVQNIIECGLELDPDGVPHPRHANIVGWPVGDVDSRAVAKKLGLSARFLSYP